TASSGPAPTASVGRSPSRTNPSSSRSFGRVASQESPASSATAPNSTTSSVPESQRREGLGLLPKPLRLLVPAQTFPGRRRLPALPDLPIDDRPHLGGRERAPRHL